MKHKKPADRLAPSSQMKLAQTVSGFTKLTQTISSSLIQNGP